MSDTVNNKELVRRIAGRLSKDPAEVEATLDATLDTICEAIRQEESVTLRNFGKFYVRRSSSGTVFKFSPAQRLRALLGWSSTYKGAL